MNGWMGAANEIINIFLNDTDFISSHFIENNCIFNI